MRRVHSERLPAAAQRLLDAAFLTPARGPHWGDGLLHTLTRGAHEPRTHAPQSQSESFEQLRATQPRASLKLFDAGLHSMLGGHRAAPVESQGPATHPWMSLPIIDGAQR